MGRIAAIALTPKPLEFQSSVSDQPVHSTIHWESGSRTTRRPSTWARRIEDGTVGGGQERGKGGVPPHFHLTTRPNPFEICLRGATLFLLFLLLILNLIKDMSPSGRWETPYISRIHTPSSCNPVAERRGAFVANVKVRLANCGNGRVGFSLVSLIFV